MAAPLPENVKAAVLAEHVSGNSTIRGIIATLGRRGIRVSQGTVANYLRAAGAVSAALSTPSKPLEPTPPDAPTGQAEPAVAVAEAPPRDLVANVADAAHAHAEAWQRLYHAHAHTLRELERRIAALGAQVACPKCGGGFEASPDFTVLAKLRTFAGDLLGDIARLRPVEQRRPEDDPANVEAARVLVATLRARLTVRQAAA